MNHPHVFPFGLGHIPKDTTKVTLGGKGAALAQMTALELPVPPGVIISTPACAEFRKMGSTSSSAKFFVSGLVDEVLSHYTNVVAPHFGYMPLVSVRSGARVSMPGMMDTILNVGITSKNLHEWVERIGEVPALDCYRRLIEMLSGVVFEFGHEDLRDGLADHVLGESEADRLRRTIAHYKAMFLEVIEFPFPDTFEEQLCCAVAAVFKSWDNERAIEYRNLNGIPHDWGTAVTVQTMVFGNYNDKSCSGVMFSRCPKTGKNVVFGEYLPNAQGEDVVAGTHTPYSLNDMDKWNAELYFDLVALCAKLEKHYGDMQDIEFTVQDGKLFVLQTRNGKRSAQAAFRIAYDMAKQGLIDKKVACSRVTGRQYYTLKNAAIDPSFKTKPTFQGLPAAGQLVTGTAVLSAEAAKAFKGPCILVAKETTPDDFGGMVASVGILTSTGGATSHAAVVARGMDKTCVVGATDMKPGSSIKAGDKVTLDGATGRVWVNVEVPIVPGNIPQHVEEMMEWSKAETSLSAGLRIKVDPQNLAAIPTHGSVVLDLTGLLNQKYTKRMFRELLAHLTGLTQLSGVLDLTHESGAVSSGDHDYRTLMGIGGATSAPKQSGNVSAGDIVAIKASFGLVKWVPKFMSRWTVKTTDYTARKVLSDRGWGLVTHADTLGDLFSGSGGMVTLSPSVMDVLASQNVEPSKMFELMAAAGKKCMPELVAIPEEALAFELFGKE